MLHIVAWRSAGWTLKNVFKEQWIHDKIFVLDDMLNWWPLDSSRKEYFRKYHRLCQQDDYLALHEDDTKLFDLQKTIWEQENIIVWVGKNSSEQSLLRAVAHYITTQSLHIIDITKTSIPYTPRAVWECSLEMVLALHKGWIEEIKQDSIQRLADEWDILVQENTACRVRDKWSLNSKKESYYDTILIQACSQDYQIVAKIIWDVFRYIDDVVSDSFLDMRLRKLVLSWELVGKNTHTSMREMQVKR